MDLLNSRDKINSFFILFIILLLSVIFCAAPGWALDPTVTDVTTRSFSVVWTEDNTITDLGQYSLTIKNTNDVPLKEYTKTHSVIGDANQIVIRMESDDDALARRVYKFEVIGLDFDTTFRCQGTKSDGSSALFIDDYEEVTTEKFRGLAPEADSNDTDIVTNDIVHLAVYNETDKKPALGALLMGEIYSNAECTELNRLSDYPLTGWVGVGMPGEIDKLNYQNGEFDSNNVSYKNFTALNLNNLFGRDNNYPLQLTGDNAGTPQVEGEYIKVNVVAGIDNVAGETEYIIPVPEIAEVEVAPNSWQKISSAKVLFAFKFLEGYSSFSYPCQIPQVSDSSGSRPYETGDLFRAIQAVGGEVLKIHRWNGSGWDPTYEKRGDIKSSVPMVDTGGYIIQMTTPMTQSLVISGYPKVEALNFSSNSYTFCNFPQLADFYETGDLFEVIKAAGGDVFKIFRWNGSGWDPTYEKRGEIKSSVLMERAVAYMVQTKENGATDLDPLGE